jgi:hypothetical protein
MDAPQIVSVCLVLGTSRLSEHHAESVVLPSVNICPAQWAPEPSGEYNAAMESFADALPHMTPAGAPLAEDEVRTCLRVLRAIEADRSHLTRLSREERRELLMLAGLVAKPERQDLVRMAKAFRRADREAAKAHDRHVIE